ncbi:ribonuclease R [Olsenella massiliensis]|uniref:ribonuclease R n=1 Tax=Olsenella massiliensis TaxID=1622075 RepID=UPI00071DAF91|nr:ribonuclease R [Olsenella massiliensis]
MSRGTSRPRGSRRRKRSAGTRKRPPLAQGVIRVSRSGSATVETTEGRFPVVRGGVREAMSGDTVQVSLARPRRGQERVARVQHVIERARQSFVGSYGTADPLGVVVPLDVRLRRDFFVTPQDDCARRLGVHAGDVVVARILEYPGRASAGIVTIERRVGSQDALDIPMESVIASYDLRTEFPDAVLDEARALRDDVAEALAAPDREDLRSHCVVTIDPADARDFDDAVGARRLEDGFELEVHIADVSHYVAWGSSIDNEAKLRTCSVYLADRVIPMLPERLCNDLCSLRPAEDRLALSILMRLGADGRLLDVRATRSVIRSDARLTYGQADALLEGRLTAEDLPCVADLAQPVATSIAVLDEIARLRLGIRHDRGAIDFLSREAKVTLDDRGRPTGVVVRERTRATSLIEEAMLIANEGVAKMLADADVECAYRVHERPSPEALKATLPALQELGLAQGSLGDALAAGSPVAIQQVLADARYGDGEFLANSLLLRAQKRAIYLPHNEGHFALGADAYCHFTSPIRRYPDVTVHRALLAYLDGTLDSREQREVRLALAQICRSCSDRERAADGASRDSQRVKMAELFQKRLGQSFAGVVVGVERYGLFVMLDDSCAEGLVPVRALGDEWFSYDDARMTLTGEESGTTWRVGARLEVTVTGASPERGQITFALTPRRQAAAPASPAPGGFSRP